MKRRRCSLGILRGGGQRARSGGTTDMAGLWSPRKLLLCARRRCCFHSTDESRCLPRPLLPLPAAPRAAPAEPLQDFEGGSLYGLEKLWAFHHYTGFPRDQPGLEMIPKVGGCRVGIQGKRRKH